MDEFAKRLGKRITNIREKKGITSEMLAYENGISKGYLSDIENGKRLPSLRMLVKLSKALGVSIRDFF